MANYSFYAIPIYWSITLFPHPLIKKSNDNKWDNLNPRGIDTYASYQKAKAAHKNGLENASFFIGAVLAGNMAGVSPCTMNAVTGSYLALRVLYTVLYVRCTRQETSRLRSLTRNVSTMLLNAWAASV